jgi:hypothetical protein
MADALSGDRLPRVDDALRRFASSQYQAVGVLCELNLVQEALPEQGRMIVEANSDAGTVYANATDANAGFRDDLSGMMTLATSSSLVRRGRPGLRRLVASSRGSGKCTKTRRLATNRWPDRIDTGPTGQCARDGAPALHSVAAPLHSSAHLEQF